MPHPDSPNTHTALARRWPRRFGWLVAMAALALVLPDYVSTRRSPVGGPDDADLRVRDEVIAPPQDGLYHLRAAVAVLDLDEADVLSLNHMLDSGSAMPDARARASLEELLDRNELSLDGLRASVEAPHFLMPEMSADEFEFAPEIPLETEQLVDLLRVRALLLAGSASWDPAFESALDILRLARRIEGAQRAVLTTTMMSVGYRADGLETLRRLVAMAPLENQQARRWAEDLRAYRSDPAAWKRMWAVEYQQWKSLLGWIGERAAEESRTRPERLAEAEITHANLNALRRETTRTLETFAELTRTYQRASDHNCEALGEMRFPAPTDRRGGGAIASDLALDINAPDYRDFFLRRCAEDTALAATQTLIALRAFQHDNDRLPDVLGELVPRYLTAIPTDAFRGEPIRYSKTDRLVFSPGTAGLEPPPEGLLAAYEAFRDLRYPIEF
ncbi:MAG: hypothetical protein QF570_20760 [Myxococcota bacterium]|jgi:hypothetical protein|nr:hypothetical protein [Myxococcota bacterium]